MPKLQFRLPDTGQMPPLLLLDANAVISAALLMPVSSLHYRGALGRYQVGLLPFAEQPRLHNPV